MKAIFRAKSYWIISILATIIIFMAMFNLGQTYKSETDILISPKSPAAENNINLITENAKQISSTLIFYNDILKNNQGIKDLVADKTNFERKNYWNSISRAEILKNSGVIRLTILDNDKTQNEKLSRTASLTLAQELSKYYNVSSDIEVKIIDGPILSLGKKYDNWILFGASFIIAFLAVLFSFAISAIIGKNRAKEIIKTPAEAPAMFYDDAEFESKRKKLKGLPTPEEAKDKLNQLLRGEY